MKRTLIGLTLIAVISSASHAVSAGPSHAKGKVVHSFGIMSDRVRNAQAHATPAHDWRSQVLPYQYQVLPYEYDEALSPPAGQ